MNKNIFILLTMILIAASMAWAKDTYYCPMHPHYTSDKPGSCPICGMSLVKRETSVSQQNIQHEHKVGEEVAGYVPIHIDSAKQQLMGVRTTKVIRKPFLKIVRATGYVAHDFELYEAQLEYISAWQQYYAFRSRRPVSDEFRQDWRAYYTSSSRTWTGEDFRKSQERLIKAEFNLRHMGLANADLEKLREIKYGRPWVQPSLLFFNDEHSYWVYADIFENDLGFIDVGQKALVEIPAFGNTIEGTVRAVAESVAPNTRTVRVRIELPRSNKIELKEGMFVNVTMPVELNNTLVVPRDALMMTGTRAIAFMESSEGNFIPKEVKTGWESDGFIEVKSGLKEADVVVSGANFLVDSESRLQAALEGSSEGHSHGQ